MSNSVIPSDRPHPQSPTSGCARPSGCRRRLSPAARSVPDPTVTGMASVVDDRDHNRFAFSEDGQEAELVYRVNGNRLVLIHTGVPEFFRGQGIGARLVQAAVDRASKSGETVVPLCPYARKWLEDHADVASTVAIDWAEP
jgi:uncharacterized protein